MKWIHFYFTKRDRAMKPVIMSVSHVMYSIIAILAAVSLFSSSRILYCRLTTRPCDTDSDTKYNVVAARRINPGSSCYSEIAQYADYPTIAEPRKQIWKKIFHVTNQLTTSLYTIGNFSNQFFLIY